MPKSDVIVVGGGVIGCSIAWRLAQEGASVTLVERDRPGAEASSAAAGLLLPYAGREGGRPLLELWLASLRRYPDFIAALREEAGMPLEFRISGSLQVAPAEADLPALRENLRLQQAQGVKAELWSAEQVRSAEPAVAPSVAGAIFFPEHALVDNRALVSCLAMAATRRGVILRSGSPVTGLLGTTERVTGVEIAGEGLEAGAVVNAAGSWAGRLDARFPLPVGPAKGQILAFEARPPLIQRIVSGPNGSLGPRADGRHILGSTVEDAGYDKRNTAQGVRSLIDAAIALCPALAPAPLQEVWAGLRPVTPDRSPILGQVTDGLYVATGHFKNGILGTPITAEALAGIVLHGTTSLPIGPFSPGRFVSV